MTAVLIALLIIVVVGLTAAAASVRVLREYERAIVFRLGRLIGQKGPGVIFLIPGVDRMVRMDLRTITFDIAPQQVITRDNVPASVSAVAYFRVIDPTRAVIDVEKFRAATQQISQTTLRAVLGQADLDTLLSGRDRLNEELQHQIDQHTDPWGIKVTTVEIKDVGIPREMQRAMARQAEAERERRAKIIGAEGEYQASQRLFDAAQIMSANPASLQLRYLQTLLEVSGENSSTIVFPIPIDLLKPLVERGGDVVKAMADQQQRQHERAATGDGELPARDTAAAELPEAPEQPRFETPEREREAERELMGPPE